MMTILISIGNVKTHTFLFNIRGKTIYNAGMATSCLLFVPCAYFFFLIIHTEHLVTTINYVVGIPLGITLNVVGIFKIMTGWLTNIQLMFQANGMLFPPIVLIACCEMLYYVSINGLYD